MKGISIALATTTYRLRAPQRRLRRRESRPLRTLGLSRSQTQRPRPTRAGHSTARSVPHRTLAALIGRKHFVTLRRCVQGIPTDYDGARPLIRVEPEQEIGEADYGALAVAEGGASVITIEDFLRRRSQTGRREPKAMSDRSAAELPRQKAARGSAWSDAPPLVRTSAKMQGIHGWGGRIRTSGWRNQNPLPYHLATPQRAARLGGPGGKRADNSSGCPAPQWAEPDEICSRRRGARTRLTRSTSATRPPSRNGQTSSQRGGGVRPFAIGIAA